MGFFDGARGRLYCRDRPVDGAVAAVALLPGSGQHSGHYHEFTRRMNAADIAVWTLDTAGQGLSEGDPAEPVRLPDLVDDAVRFLGLVRELVPGVPLTLMGHSLGALTALAALGAVPPAVFPGNSVSPNSAFPPRDHRNPAGLVLCGTPPRALGNYSAGRPPVLAIHGVDDRRTPIEPVRSWAHGNESVQLREYPDAGHDLLHERVRGRVTTDIVQWLQEIIAGPER